MKTYAEIKEAIVDYAAKRQGNIPAQHSNDKALEQHFKDAGITHSTVQHNPHPTDPTSWKSTYRVPMKHYEAAKAIVKSNGLSKSHLIIGDMDR